MSSQHPDAEHVPSGTEAPRWEYGQPSSGPDPGQVVAAELVQYSSPSQRPVWTAILVCVTAIIMSAVVSGVVLAVTAFADRGAGVLDDVGQLKAWVMEFGRTREGLLVMLLPSQVVFLLVACAAAMISPRPFARRLSLGTGVLPLWTWIVFLVGTPIVGIVSSEILSLFVDDLSDNLKLIESMMRSHLVRSLPLLLVLVAVVPGLVEEIMFRGYLQTRLAERWSPVWAVAVSAVIFSAAHMDPLHGIGVLPLGLWLGAVAWRTASVWPAVLCHTVNNAVAVIGLKLQPDEKIGVAMDNVTLVVLMVCGPAFLLSLYLFRNR
ncbi:MAG: CPBP family intramembrane metalloprotease [Pirellulaceae bacterium]|nr:CPBP family intramembrane metalloprotease [Pirellulaceae bacterium]